MPKLYWETVDLGDPVTPLTKPQITRVQIAKFASASQDWSPLHLDDDFAKSAGYGNAFAHGAMSLGFAMEAVGNWAENGRILSTSAKFQKLVWPGDILTAKGVIVQRYELNEEPRVDVDVWAENQNHDIVMNCQITCILWRNEKEEKKGKGIFPPISAETLRSRSTARPIVKPAMTPAARDAGSETKSESARRAEAAAAVKASSAEKAAATAKAVAKATAAKAAAPAKPATPASKPAAPVKAPAPAKPAAKVVKAEPKKPPAPAKVAAKPAKAPPPPAKKPAAPPPKKAAKKPEKPAPKKADKAKKKK